MTQSTRRKESNHNKPWFPERERDRKPFLPGIRASSLQWVGIRGVTWPLSPRCVIGTHQIFVFFTWLSFTARRMSPAPSLKVQGSHRYKYLLQLFRFVSLLSLSHCSYVTWLSFWASRGPVSRSIDHGSLADGLYLFRLPMNRDTEQLRLSTNREVEFH